MERSAWRLDEPVTVTQGDAFISLYPDAVTKLTYGIDFTYKSRAIGKQWESWRQVHFMNWIWLSAKKKKPIKQG